jgi:tetratricopeptide (TPR) repeat protein
MTTLRTLTAALLTAGCLLSAQAQSLRPEVGKPLQQASEYLRAGKAREALAKVKEADAVGNKTATEQLMIERMRGSAAQRAGDNATAVAAFESVYNSGKLSGSEQAQVAESLAFAYSQLKNFPKANQWAQKAEQAGSHSSQLQQLQAYLQAQSGDYSAIARDAAASIAAAEQAGKRPDEGDLLRLADAYQRTNNAAGQSATLEKLLTYYGKKDYWEVALGRLPRKPGFSDRFTLDLLRLKLATGTLTTADEFMEMAQLALQAGLPAEAKAIADKGFTAGILGKGDPAQANRHQRLLALAVKQDAEQRANLPRLTSEAKSGDDMVDLGVVLASMGKASDGVAMIEKGIEVDRLKRPEDAKLRLGQAMMLSGKSKAKAQQVLRSVQGNDGASDIGRLNAILAGQK